MLAITFIILEFYLSITMLFKMSKTDFYLRSVVASFSTTAAILSNNHGVVGPVCGGLAVFASLDAIRISLLSNSFGTQPFRPEKHADNTQTSKQTL